MMLHSRVKGFKVLVIIESIITYLLLVSKLVVIPLFKILHVLKSWMLLVCYLLTSSLLHYSALLCPETAVTHISVFVCTKGSYLEIKKQMDKLDPLAHPLLQW